MKSQERTVVWKSDESGITTLEILHFIPDQSNFRVDSTIAGVVNNSPIALEYTVLLNSNWYVRHVEAFSKLDKRSRLSLSSDTPGQWHEQSGIPINDLQGCIDIDLSLSPFTNTLPIRRLGNSLHQRTAIKAVFIDLLRWECKAVQQHYTQISPLNYKYDGAGDYSADLLVDEDGFIVNYPDLFQRIYP